MESLSSMCVERGAKGVGGRVANGEGRTPWGNGPRRRTRAAQGQHT